MCVRCQSSVNGLPHDVLYWSSGSGVCQSYTCTLTSRGGKGRRSGGEGKGGEGEGRGRGEDMWDVRGYRYRQDVRLEVLLQAGHLCL